MKKTVVFLMFSLLLGANVFAQNATMPTDDEIMEVINKYNFTQEQKEFLLKETRKKLQESFATGEIQNLMNEQALQEDVSIQELTSQNAKSATAKKERKGLSNEHSFRAAKQRREQLKQQTN